MDLTERRELNRAMGTGMSRSFDLAFTPLVFTVLGFVVDRWLGTVPLFTIVFFAWALVVKFVLLWRAYDAEMTRHEEEGSWARRS